MSLLSPDRLVAVLTGAEVALFRQRGGRRECLARCAVAPPRPPLGPATLAALQQALATQNGLRGELCVILGSELCRFRLIPWSAAITSPGELEQYARSCFEEIHGNAVASWRLQVSADSAGRPRLAAALERELLEGLQALAQAAKLRLVSVQPYLMAAFNRFARQLTQPNFLFLLAEPGRTSQLLARGGAWVSVRSTAGNGSDAALEALIQRETQLQALAGEQLETVYLHAPGQPSSALAVSSQLTLEQLSLPLPTSADSANDALWSMAMVVS